MFKGHVEMVCRYNGTPSPYASLKNAAQVEGYTVPPDTPLRPVSNVRHFNIGTKKVGSLNQQKTLHLLLFNLMVDRLQNEGLENTMMILINLMLTYKLKLPSFSHLIGEVVRI